MSTLVDNISLALISLKETLEDYLDKSTTGWKNKYTMYVSGDPELRQKTVVWKNPKRNEVSLPLILIDTGFIETIDHELGTDQGRDHVTLMISVSARDDNQLRTLSNMIRRKLNNWVYTVYDYKANKSSVGTGTLAKASLVDISDADSNNIAERYNAIINTILEINVESFV